MGDGGWNSPTPTDPTKAKVVKLRQQGFSDGYSGREIATREAVYLESYRRGVQMRAAQEAEEE